MTVAPGLREMPALSSLLLERMGAIRIDIFESLRFATGMTIVGGVFVMVQTLLLAEHLCTLGGRFARNGAGVPAAGSEQ
jgi:hypothetical protein